MRMDEENKALWKAVFKAVLIIAVCVLLCRFSKGVFALALMALGVIFALSKKTAYAVACYAFFPLLIVLNGTILSKAGLTGLTCRVAPLVISIALLFTATGRRGKHRLPFGYLMPYLFLVTLTSMQGWAPQVSFLKAINFFLFLIGMWIGLQNLDTNPLQASRCRIVALALVTFIIFGSLCTMPFPSIGYSLNTQSLVEQYGVEYANRVFKEHVASGGVSLFSGLLNQSQALAPTAAICTIFVACDMFFIHQKISLIHVGLIIAGLIETFLTRSRTGLFTLIIGITMITTYGAKNIVLPFNIKRNIKHMIYLGLVLGAIGSCVLEVKDRTFTRWLRKNNDDSTDTRSLTEAVTASRQGLIEMSMTDFRMNPLIGMGFQVNFETMELHGKKGGLILSAPVEKGLLPIMVLGESGIMGLIVFAFFLIAFYATCHRNHFSISIIMFTTMLATNIGEATFFSPGGCGGILWMIGVVAGFSLDMMLSAQRRQAMMRPSGYMG